MRVFPLLATLILALGGPGEAGAQHADARNAGTSAGGAEASQRWRQLSPAKQAALRPLAAEWDRLDEAHRRKWQALARNFDRMDPEEQATLHSRMAEWAALSPRERIRARFNFAEVQRLAPSEERKTQWEAYRALSAEERKALAEQAAKPPRGTALPLRPVQEGRLIPLPPAALQSAHGGPRIVLKPPRASPPVEAAPAPAPAVAPGTDMAVPAAPAAPDASPSEPASPDSPAAP